MRAPPPIPRPRWRGPRRRREKLLGPSQASGLSWRERASASPRPGRRRSECSYGHPTPPSLESFYSCATNPRFLCIPLRLTQPLLITPQNSTEPSGTCLVVTDTRVSSRASQNSLLLPTLSDYALSHAALSSTNCEISYISHSAG